jgi:beta-N-acetylhexosaminidase
MARIARSFLALALLLNLGLSLAAPSSAAPASQQTAPGERAPQPTAMPIEPADVKKLMDSMSVADRVGQLFLVTFEGDDVSENSDIATLVRDYRVGGVVLLPSNGNLQTAPAEQPGHVAQERSVGAPDQVLQLTNALQLLALSAPRPITATIPISGTPVLTATAAITLAGEITATATTTPTVSQAIAELQDKSARIPLLIGLDWSGDDSGLFSGSGGFSPFPSSMAIGATWSPALSEKVGQVMGQELRAVGINLLLGPTLDVLDVPRPDNRGDLDTRTFGGDPFWVGQMARAMIRGIQAGSQGSVLTAAKHFPGQGGSDRRPEDEVATIQKSLQQLRQIELAPFAAVTAGGDVQAPGTTGALMTSHIRYRGFQGNIRQLTPPISLAPQLQDLMTLDEFAAWREAGGLLVSDALGVPALRRYYDPALQKFPHRQVAQDAFLAGNDLLFLSHFALTEKWPDQLTAIKETVLFFQDKYRSDGAFRARVDASVERIIRRKLIIYGGDWEPSNLQRSAVDLVGQVGQGSAVTQEVARAALTLIYPGPEELADRMPTAPLADEKILIITDSRPVQECATCQVVPAIPPNALQDIILRLYGPTATGQVAPQNIQSLTYRDLAQLLAASSGQERSVEQAISSAKWLVFAQLDYSPEDYPASSALRDFLAKRSDNLRDKRLVVMAFSAPYYLDTTEISKLTAYFGVYGKTAPFLETAVRALFREFSPVGAPPVSVSGINYELIRELEPAPGQLIGLAPIGPPEVISGSIGIGSQVILGTGLILDRKGHPVPDGTPVEFHMLYPAEALAIAPKVETTVGGRAVTTVILDRPGELWITARAGEATNSTRVELKVGGDSPGSIATVVPTPTPLPTASMTPTPLPTSTPTLTPTPTPMPPATPGPTLSPPRPRVALPAFMYALMGTILSGGAAFATRRGRRRTGQDERADTAEGEEQALTQPLTAALWAGVTAWTAYLLYATGWLPGATELQSGGYTWAAGAIALIAGMLSLLWSQRMSEQEGADSGKERMN